MKKNRRWLSIVMGCLVLAIVYTNCSKSNTDTGQVALVVPPVIPVAPTPSYLCGGATFISDTYSVNTSINGQNNWYADPAANFDEMILNVGSDACRGHGVWKISNAVVSGGFGNQPISPAFTKASGESTVRSVGAGDSMSYSFFFRTKSASADGSAIVVSLSPTSADRHDYLRFVNDLDAKGGFQIYTVDGAALTQKNITQNISRGVWHHIKVVNTNPDGSSDDIVKAYLDGVLVSTHTT
jgi:hypothetical protein